MVVVVVGSCMIDVVSYCDRLPKPGETIHGNKVQIGFGGKGANQCVMSALMGAQTAMVAKVGQDTFGQDYINNLKDFGINIEHVHQTDKANTGMAPIAVNKEGQNAIIIVSGANLELTEAEVKAAENVISGASLVVCQLEIKPEVTLAALKLAKKHNVLTVLNPAPGRADLHPEMFQYCDILCPNETELELLTGLPVTSSSEAETAGRKLQARGCSTLVVTLGEKGVLLLSPGSDPLHVPTVAVSPVDTTGAGDSFIGALSYYLDQSPSLDVEKLGEACRKACQIAAMSVQKAGAQTSFPRRADLPESLL